MGFVPRILYAVVGIAVVLLAAMAISLLGTLDPRCDHRTDEERRQDLRALAQSACERTEWVDELVAGRRSLFETAARFRELSAESPVDLLPYLRIFHPDRSDEELHYLHVLMYVEANCRRNGTDNSIVDVFRQEFEGRRMSGTLTMEDADPDGEGRQPY
jgi:hypothetical protein